MTYSRLQKTINKLLERANESVLDSDWESIKENAENVLSLDSSNEEAKILLDLANNNIDHSEEVKESKITPIETKEPKEPFYSKFPNKDNKEVKTVISGKGQSNLLLTIVLVVIIIVIPILAALLQR